MDANKLIQSAVLRVDLFLCQVLKALALILPLALLFLFFVLMVRSWVWGEPPLIDYDAPGVDITSEGPDGDWTEEWYKMKDGDGHE